MIAQPSGLLRIIRASDPIPVEHPIFLIFGQPGICKSSLGFSAEDPITLNFDGLNGLARTVNRRESVDIASTEQFRELRNTPEFLDPFRTLVVDTVGRALDLMSEEVIEDTPKYGRNGSLTLQGYGDLKTRFRSWMSATRKLNKNILLLSHHKEDKDGDSVFIRPDIIGASLGEVLKLADFVGFIYMSGKARILDFNPTERWFGKNPAGWKPFTIPEPAKARDFLAKLFDDGRAALGKISEVSATAAQTVMDWRIKIEGFTALEEFNRAAPEIRNLNATTQPQVVKLIIERAKAIGFAYDAQRKVFNAPQPAQESVMAL